MQFREGKLEGVRVIDLMPKRDERGFFSRTYCEDVFGSEGLNTDWPQSNHTETVLKGAVRGMHWQEAPGGEIKLIRCERGAVWDCLVDIREGSPTFGQWEAFELTEDNGIQLYVPKGIAHGFQTLKLNCRLHYMMSERYDADLARGVRWNDKDLGIKWPLEAVQLSERDRAWPAFSEIQRGRV